MQDPSLSQSRPRGLCFWGTLSPSRRQIRCTQAVEMEAATFLAAMKDFKLPDGRSRVVRHGHGPERTIQTGIGPVEVSSVKIRDRGAAIDGERIRFSSAILPARRTKSLDALLPVLYLRGISTGDFQEALAALLG